MPLRHDQRSPHQLRPWNFQFDIAPHATGSVLASCGKTQVICAVTIQESVPRWMKEQNVSGGWLTAEYSMLPYSTLDRKPRDITKGKIDGRSQEIQRLIGRSLRAVLDLPALGPRTINVDCDVLTADGGTRTTAITGSYLAVKVALDILLKKGLLKKSPLKAQLAATSVGIVQGQPLLDLDYIEDKDAAVDMNVVMTHRGQFVEVGASGEEATFSAPQLDKMLKLARLGLRQIFQLQNKAYATYTSKHRR
jgi:ribonuclease PH